MGKEYRKTPEWTGKYLIMLAVILPFFLAGCWGQTPEKPEETPDEETLAEATARDFYEALHEGMYEAATRLFGGSYETLISMNPDLDSEGGAELFAQGCQFNGFTCLRMGDVLSVERAGEGGYTFTVQFLRDDGEVFILGPCCGADETEMPPISEFTIRVVQDDAGVFKVLDLPPYVP